MVRAAVAVTAVHKEVHQRACGQKQVRQIRRDVYPVPTDDEKCGDKGYATDEPVDQTRRPVSLFLMMNLVVFHFDPMSRWLYRLEISAGNGLAP